MSKYKSELRKTLKRVQKKKKNPKLDESANCQIGILEVPTGTY